MTELTNPLIDDDLHNTLHRVRCVIAFLKEFYCLSDIPGKKPLSGFREELYTGIFFTLLSVDQALLFAMKQLEHNKTRGGGEAKETRSP